VSATGVLPSLDLEDSLKLEIQLLPPVVPEEIPADEEGEEAVAAAEMRQWERQRAWQQHKQHEAEMQAAAAASIAASEHAQRVKVASWEEELIGMLQAQVGSMGVGWVGSWLDWAG
jgi:hypothetical protein